MPTLSGPEPEPTRTERVVVTAREVSRTLSSNIGLRLFLADLIILLALSATPAPWAQVGLLGVLIVVIEQARKR